MSMRGIIQRIDEKTGRIVYYLRMNPKFHGEGNIIIAQYKEYVVVQIKPEKEKKVNVIKMFKNGELFLEGSTGKVISKEEMIEELKWCLEEYKKE